MLMLNNIITKHFSLIIKVNIVIIINVKAQYIVFFKVYIEIIVYFNKNEKDDSTSLSNGNMVL